MKLNHQQLAEQDGCRHSARMASIVSSTYPARRRLIRSVRENMKTLIQTYRRRQLRKFAKDFTSAIKERFGKKVLYSAAEVEEVAVSMGVSSKEREWAYGMFAEEDACQGFLSRIGSSKTAKELRYFLAGWMFGGGTSVGYEGMWNRFDDPDDTVMGGLSNASGSSFGGISGDPGDDGFDSGGGDVHSSD